MVYYRLRDGSRVDGRVGESAVVEIFDGDQALLGVEVQNADEFAVTGADVSTDEVGLRARPK